MRLGLGMWEEVYMRKTKGISVDDIVDADVIEYLDGMHNFSGYVKQLIRDEMHKKDINTVIIEQIEKYMEGRSLSGLSCLSEKIEDNKGENEVSIDRGLLDDIMNM